jgi:CheY-like chemotaxis protein
MTTTWTNPDGGRHLPRLLLVDDDAISREVMSMLLQMHGFPVEAAEDGKTALARVREAAAVGGIDGPEVVVMDTQMPGLSGLELIGALREVSRARIVAISGSPVSETILQAADGFLLKPVEAEQLEGLLTWGEKIEVSAGAVEAPSLASASLEEPLIDAGVLGKLTAMMPAKAVREIYAAVASDLATRLVTLEAAMDTGDSGEVARIGHAIKGGCAMVGISTAMEAAARLEASNRRETWSKELLQLRFAHSSLERILSHEFPT